MIKFKLFLIAPLLLTIPCKGKINQIYQYKDVIDEIIATPSSGSSFNLTVAASSTVAEYRKITCSVYNPIYDEEEQLFSTTFSTVDFIETRTVKCHINWEDAEVTLKLYGRRTSPIFEHTFVLKNLQNYINVANYAYKSYTTDRKAYYFFHGYENYLEEFYRFNNIGYTYTPDIGYYYDLSTFTLNYSLIEPLTKFQCRKASFYVDNSNHFFDDIRDEGINGTGCEITLDYSNTTNITFKFAKQMYVDPISLHMSKQQLPGYVKTDKFYFPVNYFNDKDSELLLFTLYECGYNRVTISIPFEFTVISKYYGACANSDYCLGSENSEPDFDLGKTIEH